MALSPTLATVHTDDAADNIKSKQSSVFRNCSVLATDVKCLTGRKETGAKIPLEGGGCLVRDQRGSDIAGKALLVRRCVCRTMQHAGTR